MTCYIPGCPNERDPNQGFCDHHFSQVPEKMQKRIRAAYTRAKGWQSEDYQLAIFDALQSVFLNGLSAQGKRKYLEFLAKGAGIK